MGAFVPTWSPSLVACWVVSLHRVVFVCSGQLDFVGSPALEGWCPMLCTFWFLQRLERRKKDPPALSGFHQD